METLPRRILVLGLGRSGGAVARYLAEERTAGADVDVAVVDEGSDDAASARAKVVREYGVPVTLGTSDVEGTWDLVVASPGIPPGSALMQAARATGAPVISEIEFAYRCSSSPFVAVTGTNGKTTTTALITHLLRESGIGALAVGNIGPAATGAVRSGGRDTVLVVEVSSFQLALTDTFRPRVAVLLNITPDHADWHGSLSAYAADKGRVFANMGPGDTAVIDVDDPGSATWVAPVEAQGVRVVRVSRTALHAGGASVVNGSLVVEGPNGRCGLVRTDELRIRGDHNVSNALAGAAAALAIGASAQGVREGLRTFQPIAHRLEPVGVVAGVEYYNDSKATNPDAVLKALTAFDGLELTVLLGGRNKGNDFTALARAVAARCRRALLFGESAPELEAAFAQTDCETERVGTMAGAVAAAALAARPGEVVLLSPACASFDEFTSYEERGMIFREIVRGMAEDEEGETP